MAENEMSVPGLEDLARHTETLAASSAELRAELRQDRARVRRDRTVYLTLIMFLIVSTLGLMGVALTNRMTNATIRSCVDPQGECYKRSMKHQQQLVGEPSGPLNSVAVASAACGAANPGDVAATLKCTEKALPALLKQTKD